MSQSEVVRANNYGNSEFISIKQFRHNNILPNMEDTKLMNNIRNGYAKTMDDHCQLITGTQDESPMQMFYKDKGIFLTGGTGFFGKIIIEKLLRVTEVAQIYLLIRTKKGKDAHARIEDLFNDPVFAKMKQINPKYRCQITIISGDCSLPGLGISPDERETIKENVNIVLHSAATVRFDEKLKMAIAINVHGIQEIIKLAKEIVNLKALVHVSTAFAHCNMRYIKEQFYSSAMTADNAMKLTQCLDENTLNTLTPTIIKGYPNTYTYTKVLAEDVVQQHAQKLPVTIFRPGIVITSYREPVTGWIDNMYGPCGVIVGIGSGVLRVFTGNMNNKAHIVPVDLCVNALLASAWDVARNKYETPPIYNYVPDVDNMVTWRNYMETGFKYVNEVPMRKSIWYPCFTIVPHMWQYHILCFLYHTLPAMFMDLVMVLMGKKPRMIKIYRKIHKFSNVLKFFSSNEFRFDNDNVRRLIDKLDERDRRLFAFDMRDLDWPHLFRVSLYGLRLYVAKDDPNNLPESRRRIKRMMVLHYTLLAIVYSLTIWALYGLVKLIFF